MTKDELEQEAEQYSYDVPIYQVKQQLEKIQKAYVAGAEPREKRIEELEKENAELKEEFKNNEDFATVAYMQGADNQKKKSDKQILKAKKIIRKLSQLKHRADAPFTCDEYIKLIKEAEQFLKEVEK